MKKIISFILTVSMLLSITSIASAQQSTKARKPAATTTVTAKLNTKAVAAKSNGLEKSKAALIRKCISAVEQLGKLKGYIETAQIGLTESDSILAEAKTKIESAIQMINDSDANNNINSYIERINAAKDSKELKAIAKELQKSWMSNQNFMKRISGLASASRLNKVYEDTNALVEKLGAGIDAIGDDAANALKKDELKKESDQIEADLEEAHNDYLDAVKLYSVVILDGVKADKNFKDAHAKLMEAKDELHDVLISTKQLLVKIKNLNKPVDEQETEEADDDADQDNNNTEVVDD
jgi:hypothetical protein